jgi:hypothetical protein
LKCILPFSGSSRQQIVVAIVRFQFLLCCCHYSFSRVCSSCGGSWRTNRKQAIIDATA